MDKDELKEILDLADDFAGSVEDLLPSVIKIKGAILKFGPEIKGLFAAITDGIVDLRARAIRRYMEVHRFTKEEAIIITLNDSSLFNKMTIESGRKAKK